MEQNFVPNNHYSPNTMTQSKGLILTINEFLGSFLIISEKKEIWKKVCAKSPKIKAMKKL